MHNLCDKIYKALNIYFDDEKLFYTLKDLKDSVKEGTNSLLQNVTNLCDDTLNMRAEFRFKLNTVSSMVPLVDYSMNDQFLNEHSIVLNLEDVIDLLRYWITLLYTPIMNSLSEFIGKLRFNNHADHLLRTHLPTISAFESLIEFTLFGGEFKSFLGHVMWSATRNENESLRLKKSILKYNRLNFEGACWNNGLKVVQGSDDLLDHLMSKWRVKKSTHVRESYQLLSQLSMNPCVKSKAKLLWDSYFKHLWTQFEKDFDFVDENSYSISNIKTSRSVFIKNEFIGYEDGVGRIFSAEKLEGKPGTNCWNLPFLLCYKMITRDSELESELNGALIEYAVKYLEYIHDAGPKYRFFKQTDHHFIKMSNIYLQINKAILPKKLFSQHEINLFCIGLNYFKNRHNVYNLISKSKILGFSKKYPPNSARKSWNNTQLRNLRQRLRDKNELLIDDETMILYHSNSTVEECTPVPGIHYSEPEDDVEVSDIITDKIFKENKKCKLFIENGADFIPSAKKNQAEPSTSNHEIDSFTFLKSDDISEQYEKDLVVEIDFENYELVDEVFDSQIDNSIQKVESLIKSLGIDNVAQHLKVICSFPHLNDNIFPKTWSESFADSISSKSRNCKKWNELKDKFIMSGLIVVKRVENNGKWLKRHFRNFKIDKEPN